MPKHVAIAILYQNSQFLMQLREQIAGILYPGYWGFFGGHLEPGESPETAMVRELMEEIAYTPPQVTPFACYEGEEVVRHVFHAPLLVPLSALELNEGWDLGLLSVEDIRRGDRYSERAGQVRPLGKPHQQILLDFLEQGLVSIEAHG